jgi:hypothetical protein
MLSAKFAAAPPHPFFARARLDKMRHADRALMATRIAAAVTLQQLFEF